MPEIHKTYNCEWKREIDVVCSHPCRFAFTSMTISRWSIAHRCDKLWLIYTKTLWHNQLIKSQFFFYLIPASKREAQHPRHLSDESMAECKIACDGRLGWRWFPFSRFTSLRGSSRGHYNIRSWSNEIWNVSAISSGSWLRLGVLWESSAHPLLC